MLLYLCVLTYSIGRYVSRCANIQDQLFVTMFMPALLFHPRTNHKVGAVVFRRSLITYASSQMLTLVNDYVTRASLP